MDVLPRFEKKTTKIAYYDPFDVYSEVKEDLSSRLPLVNLHWHPVGRPLRSIPSLDIDLVEETTSAENTPKHQMLGLSNSPYLKIIFIKCEDNDTYRTLVRKMIREWLTNNVIGLRDPTEWLIIHYVPPGSKSYSGSRFRSGVFDKIRTDFNASKKSRCIQIQGESKNEMEQMEMWSEVLTKLKEGVLDAFSKRVELYQEEIVKSEAKKAVLGWNFGTYFVMKEGLALSFDAISLYDDALILYDQLEQESSQLSSKPVSMFDSVGFDEEDSAVQPLLPMSSNSGIYRHKIMSNKISLFEFQCYLFSQQAHVLLYISKTSSAPSVSALKIGELYLRLRTFLAETSGMLKQNKKSSLKIAEWVYNVANEFYEATSTLEEGLAREVSEGRGEILLQCRRSLEEGAMTKGWFIKGPLSEVSLQDDEENGSYSIVSEKFNALLKDEETFQNEYRRLTLKAIDHFQIARMDRTIERLSSQLALLEYQCGNYQKAVDLLKDEPSFYSTQGWDYIATYLLYVYGQCLEKVGNEAELFQCALKLIHRGNYLTAKELSHVSATVKALSGKIESEIPADDLFSITVVPYVQSESFGVHSLTVKVKSNIPEDISFDSGLVLLKNNDPKELSQMRLTSVESVVKGKETTELTFTTSDFRQGLFEVTNLLLQQGKLRITKSFADNTEPVYVQFYCDVRQVWGELRAPVQFTLNDHNLWLCVHFPEPLDECSITVKTTSGRKLFPERSELKGGEMQSFNGNAGIMKMKKIGKATAIIQLPFSSNTDKKNIVVTSHLTCTKGDHKFTTSFTDSITISLLVDATEHDNYKMRKLFARFCISSRDKNDPVFIEKVDLKPSAGYEVSSPIGTDQPAIAFHASPLNYVFSIQQSDDHVSSGKEASPLSLTIYNRSTKAECLARIKYLLFTLADDEQLYKYILLIFPVLETLQFDLIKYSLEGEIHVTSSDIAVAIEESGVLSFTPESDSKLLLQRIQTLDWSLVPDIIDMSDITYQLTIPVSISQVDRVHSIELKLPSNSQFILAEPIPSKLIIQSTTYWACEEHKEEMSEQPVQLYFEIGLSQESWAISGKRIGKFTVGSNVMTEQEIDIQLIPLREGKLMYPRITIFRTDVASKQEMFDYKSSSRSAMIVPERDKLAIRF